MALVFFCSLATATSITSELSVTTVGVHTATMSHYSHLKDAQFNTGISLQDGTGSGDFESKAFNYMVNGLIDFHDKVEYNDGSSGEGAIICTASQSAIPKDVAIQGTGFRGDSYASHDLHLDFEGEEIISQFFTHTTISNSSQASARKDVQSKGLIHRLSDETSRIDLDASMGIRNSLEGGEDGTNLNWKINVSKAQANLRSAPCQVDDARIGMNLSKGLYLQGAYIPLKRIDGWLPWDSKPEPPFYDPEWMPTGRDQIFG